MSTSWGPTFVRSWTSRGHSGYQERPRTWPALIFFLFTWRMCSMWSTTCRDRLRICIANDEIGIIEEQSRLNNRVSFQIFDYCKILLIATYMQYMGCLSVSPSQPIILIFYWTSNGWIMIVLTYKMCIAIKDAKAIHVVHACRPLAITSGGWSAVY